MPPVPWGIRALGFEDAYRRLDRYAAKPVVDAWGRASMAGARLAARAIRAQTPVGRTGNLRRSVKARRPRSRGVQAILSGRLGVTLAGPFAPHRHLVIRGHRIVTHAGVDTGRRSRANPFVDRAVDPIAPAIEEVVRRELIRQLGG